MAPVYDFRHVELDKIGRGKRIVKPPGGECSDIFAVTSPATSPNGELSTPRKTNKTYMLQSSIFSPQEGAADGPLSPNGSSSSNGKLLDTAVRLFGDTPDSTPRKVVDRQRSSIFEEEVQNGSSRPHSLKATPARRPQINPITGAYENGGSPNGYLNGGSRNGTPTNGVHSNGGTPNGGTPNGGTPTNGVYSNGGTPNGYSNGYTNGHTSPDSPMNGSARFRNPPGGKSSGIF